MRFFKQIRRRCSSLFSDPCSRRRQSRTSRLNCERLTDRLLMAADIVSVPDSSAEFETYEGSVYDTHEGEVTFNARTGVLTITGDGLDDTATVRELGNGRLKVEATFQTSPGNFFPQYEELTMSESSVRKIVFYGHGGDDVFTNESSIPSSAWGGSGQDVLTGGSANDLLDGGDQDDTIRGGYGSDTLNGGDGDDFIDGEGGNDTINGDGGRDEILGGRGDDTLEGDGDDDVIYGNGGNDTIDGGDGEDLLYGGTDNDIVFGRSGNDAIFGGDGEDRMIGGDGADNVHGGGGADYLDGGMDGIDDSFEDKLWGDGGGDTFVQYYVYTSETFDTGSHEYTIWYWEDLDTVMDFTGSDGDLLDEVRLS